MPLSPADVQKQISMRFNKDEICMQIDAELKRANTLSTQVFVKLLPDQVATDVANIYRRLGWSVTVSRDNDRGFESTVFTLSYPSQPGSDSFTR